MAIRVKVHNEAIVEIMKSAGTVAEIERETERVRDACNSQSSWGGYDSTVEVGGTRARGRVWSFDDRDDEARDNRMVRNL